jgi:hypothetical protein
MENAQSEFWRGVEEAAIGMVKPSPDMSGMSREESLVRVALLPEATKAAIRRAFARRRASDPAADFAAAQDDIDYLEATDFSLHVGEVEAMVCVGVGKPAGLFRRRAKSWWIFVGQRGGAHFFPVSRHETAEMAAAMLAALHAELASPI